MNAPARTPVLFVSHGSPMVALGDDEYTRALRQFGERVRPVRGAVVASAHWQSEGALGVTAAEQPGLLYDFGGFPPKLYRIVHPCPGDPALAAEIVVLLQGAGFAAVLEPRRGLDHGVWVPLRHLFPAADVPTVQVALPRGASPERLLAMGRALAPLRERGILIVGSGGVVHDLRRVNFAQKHGPVDAWAAAFDDWVRERLDAMDVNGLLAYRRLAPEARRAVPPGGEEHFDPVFVTLGAAVPGDRVIQIYEGFQHSNLSLRTFAVTSPGHA